MRIVKLKRGGVPRVLNGKEGMTFVVHRMDDQGGELRVAHVRDYRYNVEPHGFQIWSLPEHGFEEVTE